MSIYQLLRVYDPLTECRPDGYPHAWRTCPRCDGRGTLYRDYMPAEHESHLLRGGEHDCTACWPLNRLMFGDTCSWCLSAGSAKNLIRQLAGHRCERCRHPYTPRCGVLERTPHDALPSYQPERASLWVMLDHEDSPAPLGAPPSTHWSPCDAECRHEGPIRVRYPGEDWVSTVVNQQPHWWLTEAQEAQPEGVSPEVQASWRILTVHHLNGLKHDLRWWNLASLCQRCHLEIQGKVSMERVFPLEHTPWFKPHAAGWYAHDYLGLDLTREQVDARLDELLALERMA